MSVLSSAVICEFNPLHNGHSHLLGRMRNALGADGCVVCILSGRFVQRGTPAVIDPYTRARMAVESGADLVLELPFPYCAGSAEHFARASVHIASALGVDSLTFGSESADLDLLSRMAEMADSPDFADRYAALCREGMGTTLAYTRALQQTAGMTLPEGFPNSNDLLGIAYLRANRALTAPMDIQTVRRVGDGYRDAVQRDAHYPSATALRNLMEVAEGDPIALAALLDGTMPPKAFDLLMRELDAGNAPIWGTPLLPFYHARFRLGSPAEFEGYAELSGGLAGHLCREARRAATGEEFMSLCRTKQFTDARLRRAMLFAVTGVTEADLREPPRYTTLLAATKAGCAYLKAWQKQEKERAEADSSAPAFTVVTKPADSPVCRQRALCEQADALCTLCLPTPVSAGAWMQRSPHIAEW